MAVNMENICCKPLCVNKGMYNVWISMVELKSCFVQMQANVTSLFFEVNPFLINKMLYSYICCGYVLSSMDSDYVNDGAMHYLLMISTLQASTNGELLSTVLQRHGQVLSI